jgi:hypothetical protein
MIDVSSFVRLNVVDSCALWNILSSPLLYSVALREQCGFSCTVFVKYECLHKPRSSPSAEDTELMQRFSLALARSEVVAYNLDIADLQDVTVLRNRRTLSMGELSSIAFAMKTRQAFLTDDQKARKLGGTTTPPTQVQTTPHLLGWLVFSQKVSDNDVPVIVAQHNSMGRPLAPHFTNAYREGLRCLLMANPSSLDG